MKQFSQSSDKTYVNIARLTTLVFVSLLTLLPQLAWGAPAGYVIQISRKLKMSSADTSPNKDYYLDLGEKQGVKVGDTFAVFRDMAVLNEVIGDASSLIRVPMAEITVFLVGEHTSIGRLTGTFSPASLPVMAQPFVRVGDSVQLKTNLPFEQKTP